MSTLRVATFNVLFDNRGRGPGSWAERLPLIAAAIERAAPDVLGLQEVLPSKLEDTIRAIGDLALISGPERGAARPLDPSLPLDVALTALRTMRLPRVADIARSREEVARHGELQPIVYRHDRFEPLGDGAFWISPTPERAGSMLLLAHTPFMVHWAWLRERDSSRRVLILNGHFGHAPWHHAVTARVVADQLRGLLDSARARGSAPHAPAVFLVGDFNAWPSSPLVKRLASAMCGGFLDAARAAPRRSGPPVTFHWGRGARRLGLTLDYVLARGPVGPVAAEVLDVHQGALYPSDHHPVVVEFEVGDDAGGSTSPRAESGQR